MVCYFGSVKAGIFALEALAVNQWLDYAAMARTCRTSLYGVLMTMLAAPLLCSATGRKKIHMA